MPGVAGLVSGIPGDEQLLNRMAESITHRPWQLVDKYSKPPFHVARVHLGVFNPEPQPIFNEDKTLCIFMYGKIHGYQSQMSQLMARHSPSCRNDADFCLHAYEEHGPHFVRQANLNGAFVIIICDLKKRQLVIANDRYGLSPVYYCRQSQGLLFASEVKAILHAGVRQWLLDEEAVADFFAFGWINGNRTLFEGIEVLPPASILTWANGSASIEQYWHPEYRPDYSTSELELADQLAQSYRRAVGLRMDHRLRCAISLSGGYDSRALIAAVDKPKRRSLITLSYGIPRCHDVEIAAEVATSLGTTHIYIPIDADESVAPHPEEVVYLTDGMHPMIHNSYVAPLFGKARLHLDVISEGLAAGTTLAGRWIDKRVLQAKDRTQLAEILTSRRPFSDQMMARLFRDEYYQRIEDAPGTHIANSLAAEVEHPANLFDYHMIHNMIRRTQFVGSTTLVQNFVETCPPTFDVDFFDVILRVPPELRSQHRIYRTLLKKLDPELARIPYNSTMLPADAPLWLWRVGEFYQKGRARTARLLFRLSHGRISIPNRHSFAPVDQWVRTNAKWRQFTRDTLLSPNACIREFCRQEFIQQLVEDHETGRAYHFGRINQLLTFELFLRMFVAGTLPPPKT